MSGREREREREGERKNADCSRFADAIHVTVQSSRKTPFAKVVRRASRQIKKENYARTDNYDTRTKAKNVEFFRMEGR